MTMETSEDILTLAQRRRAGRIVTQKAVIEAPLSKESKDKRKTFSSERVLRIDNFTTGPEIPTPSPPHIPQLPLAHFTKPKGFINDLSSRDRSRRVESPRLALPLFLDDHLPYSRNLLPPLITVQVNGEEIASLVNTASHISLISTRLVNTLGLRKEFIPDTSVPPSPLNTNGSPQYLVEGKLRYVELSVKGSKHVTQLYVARDLPSDIILGVDFLKKAQVKINFQDSSLVLPSGNEDTKVSFLSSKELGNRGQTSSSSSSDPTNNRSYSSNF